MTVKPRFAVEYCFFDFGGTLYEYYPSNAVVWTRIAKRLGFDFSSDDPRIWKGLKKQEDEYMKMKKHVSVFTKEDFHSLNINVLETMGIDSKGTIDFIHEEFEKRRDGYRIFPDCRATLEKIHQMGIKIGMISNSDEWHSKTRRPAMKESGILHYFDTIILSDEVKLVKPQKEIFDLALDAIGIQDGSKVMHVGDSLLDDAIGSKKAGLIPVLYDPQGFYPENEFITIKKLSEILDYLK